MEHVFFLGGGGNCGCGWLFFKMEINSNLFSRMQQIHVILSGFIRKAIDEAFPVWAAAIEIIGILTWRQEKFAGEAGERSWTYA